MTIVAARADEAEAPACLALLPQAWGRSVELLIARLDGDFAGAAAIAWRSSTSPAGFPIEVHVAPKFRRRGVGRRLFEAATELARGESPGLWTFEPLAQDGEGALFAAACGATALRRRRHFEVGADAAAARVLPLIERIRAPDGSPRA